MVALDKPAREERAMTADQFPIRTSRLGIVRAALAGAAVLLVLYAVCWIGAAVGGLSVSHMFISLFTAQPVGSQAALLEGAGWSLVFGAASGALVAFFFNVFSVGGR
jgi:hypothetical protein